MTDGGPFIAVLDYGIGNLRSAEKALQRLGADARLSADPDEVGEAAGVVLHRRPGDAVTRGDVLYELRADDAARIGPAREAAAGAVTVGAVAAPRGPLLLDRVG